MFDRTKQGLEHAWRGISKVSLIGRRPAIQPELSESDAMIVRTQMQNCLETTGGESSARARAASLGQIYLVLNDVGRQRFLTILAEEFDVEHKNIEQLCNALVSASSQQERENTESLLRSALIPARVKLLTQFNSLPSGVKFLVDMRADLFPLRDNSQSLRHFDHDFKTLLTSWFDIGFLDLHRISWSAPAALLEKLMHHEAVHQIQSWDDLKHRLTDDRRCYAYFHPRMPNEPLIFVQVALVSKIATNIDQLLDPDSPTQTEKDAKVAMFYSITNAQKGLRGISLGAFLIKRVVDDLRQEFPTLKTFATLSPVPRFLDYLRDNQNEIKNLVKDDELKLIQEAFATDSIGKILNSPFWEIDLGKSEALKTVLMRCCAYYLTKAKRNNRAFDPVADFHISNGAQLEKINWDADSSDKGLKQSGGIMVNYRYNLSEIEKNHEAYSSNGEIAVSNAVKTLLKTIN